MIEITEQNQFEVICASCGAPLTAEIVPLHFGTSNPAIKISKCQCQISALHHIDNEALTIQDELCDAYRGMTMSLDALSKLGIDEACDALVDLETVRKQIGKANERAQDLEGFATGNI